MYNFLCTPFHEGVLGSGGRFHAFLTSALMEVSALLYVPAFLPPVPGEATRIHYEVEGAPDQVVRTPVRV